mmetsp:Transcript_100585/g.189685  ORF Transcript_100585/g.189685 Transcript_100585/m.189685 type:complete len:515 (+) Transcript_100585:48-1592(+)
MWALWWLLAVPVLLCSAKFIPAKTKQAAPLLRAEKQISSFAADIRAAGELARLNRSHNDAVQDAAKLSTETRMKHGSAADEKVRRGRRHAESQVLHMAHELLQTFQAGAGYQDRVWIRDLATFLAEALEAGVDHLEAKHVLLKFFEHQGENGEIVDWYIPVTGQTDKNTVATDQETSLVQAVHTYIKSYGMALFHHPVISKGTFRHRHYSNRTVQERIELALNYLLEERLSSEHQLIYGATTMDWGDVQAEHPKGVFEMGGSIYFDRSTHPSLDVYDNAMMVLAMKNYAELCTMDNNSTCADRWASMADSFSKRTRDVLWDQKRQKWRPHVYLSSKDKATQGYHSGSPFPDDYDEDSMYYHGGTTAAILAGLHTKEETKDAYTKMMHNAALAGLQEPLTVGLTNYPPYPHGMFGNLQNVPYGYQNGGDWPWWGGRTVQGLVQMGLLEEASTALAPMIARTIKYNDFYEWYDRYNRPQGSSRFHGAAGALAKAVRMLQKAQGSRAAFHGRGGRAP